MNEKKHAKNDNFVEQSDSEKTREATAGENLEKESQNEVLDLQKQVQLLKDTVLRKAAEIENLKKRCEREKSDAISYANTKFAKDLLSVLDNFDRVMENSAAVETQISKDLNLKAIFDGIALCNKELLSTFQKHGITMVNAEKGIAFNPEFHQAMCEVESASDTPGAIIQVFQKGYVYNDRLLRPSMVSVAKKK